MGGWPCTEATSSNWTPTAGTDWLRCDSTLHAIVESLNGGAEKAIPQIAGDLGGTAASPTVTNLSHTTNASLPLTGVATQAADSVVMNASGSTAHPTAVVLPTCATSGHADVYDPSTHTWTCNAISGGGSSGIPLPPAQWGQYAWSATGSVFKVAFTLMVNVAAVCTTPSSVNAAAGVPAVRTCASGGTANTPQSYDNSQAAEIFIGSSSLPTNLEVITHSGQSATSAIRSWPVYLGTINPGSLGITDSPTTVNFAGIRFSSVAGDTNFMLVLCNASACSATSTGVAGDTALHVFKISLNDATGTATGCVDSTCITATTDYPNSVAVSHLGIVVDNTTTASVTLSLAQIYVQSSE